MGEMELDDLRKLVEEQKMIIIKKDEMIQSLFLALDKAYSQLNFQSDDGKLFITQNNSVLLDDSIFSNNQTQKHNSCMLCLFPLNDSLHGSKYPKTFNLYCGNCVYVFGDLGHKFHLLCLYETVQRRECRKVCGECWTDIDSDDQETILSCGKIEKKRICKESKDIANKILKGIQ
ncbi:uncharacterized protein TA20670 [Theileria annulata]|uniref:Uncharacterized protein n=1 Tax=Theileria annulata TaxID=5874 RepID=Q4UH23_THEAN|nr:uncharacterized protein TA20670 [Theileria annulata]CAI73616.1 hypothetical protein TA20670 [Theileria annulata]|eukprot:XP_954293.1 hypothetical protein TA20670 [Theileria annulata]